MSKTILIFALFAVTYVWSACNTVLQGKVGITSGTQASGAPGGTLNFCTNLQTASCCTAAAINAFQTKSNAVKATIQTAVAARDVFLISTRKNVISQLQTKLTTLRNNADAAAAKLAVADREEVEALGDQAESVTEDLSDLISDFNTYQASRSRCIIAILDLQASSWCLACDPASDQSGVDATTGAITVGDALKTRLSNACYDYLTGAAAQNIILHFNYIQGKLDALNTVLTKITGGTATIDDFEEEIASGTGVTQPEEDNETPVWKSIPSDCERDDCPYVYSTLFNVLTGEVDTGALAAGGELFDFPEDTEEESGSEDETGRLLAGEVRRLAVTPWAPAQGASGLTIEFPENPGAVDNSDETDKSAQLVKGALACILMVVAALVI